jgi:hypothetical protein
MHKNQYFGVVDFHLHAVLTITRLLYYWEQTGKVEADKIKTTREFLER